MLLRRRRAPPLAGGHVGVLFLSLGLLASVLLSARAKTSTWSSVQEDSILSAGRPGRETYNEIPQLEWFPTHMQQGQQAARHEQERRQPQGLRSRHERRGGGKQRQQQQQEQQQQGRRGGGKRRRQQQEYGSDSVQRSQEGAQEHRHHSYKPREHREPPSKGAPGVQEETEEALRLTEGNWKQDFTSRRQYVSEVRYATNHAVTDRRSA